MGSDYIAGKFVEVRKLAKTTGRGRDFKFYTEDEKFDWLGRHYEAQSKHDGCSGIVTLFAPGKAPDNVITQSRTGEECKSMRMQEGLLWLDFLPVMEKYGSLVLLTEAWWPGKGQFNEISGAFRKKSEARPKLKFIVSDILTLEEFDAGKAHTQYRARMDRGLGIQPKTAAWAWTTRHSPGSYGDPRDLCRSYVNSGGYDGVVLVDRNAGWVKEEDKSGRKIKVKNELSFDLRVLRREKRIGEKTGRDVYTLVVSFDGRELGVGSGVPHDVNEVPDTGDIVEVVAMDYSSDGLLREPRYKGKRFDKLEADR
ncbi:DNA ligase [Caulobacter phage ERS]|uniref:DNA ligase n=1 Tax=Caulobacter phage ERS TaxID=3020392 RepID=A0AAE9WXB4_9CAUD|nr:DNA ligase [Caulobacter phage ERS]